MRLERSVTSQEGKVINLKQQGGVGRLQRGVLALILILGIALTVSSLRDGVRLGREADVLRVWEMSQYTLDHMNPYSPTLSLLKERFGDPRGPDRAKLKDNRIWSVKNSTDWNASTPGIKPEFGPVDATYPPGAALLFAGTIGLIPETLVYPVWSIVVLVSLFLVARLLAPTLSGRPGDNWSSIITCLALFLVWPPTQHAIVVGQFSIPTLAALLGGIALGSKRPYLAGILFSLALIKPSLSLPILLYPLIKGWWKTLSVVFLSQLALLIFSGLWFMENPLQLVSQWLSIGSYFLQGAYTIQEVLNRMGWENTTKGILVSFGIVGALGSLALLRSKLHPHLVLGVLAYAAILWMYHERYDFVLLLVPLVTTLHALLVTKGNDYLLRLIPILLFVILGAALTETIYSSSAPAASLTRWAGRFSLILLVMYHVRDITKRRDGEVMYTGTAQL